MAKLKTAPSSSTPPKVRTWQPLLEAEESLALLFSEYGNAMAEEIFRGISETLGKITDPSLPRPSVWRECHYAMRQLFSPPGADIPPEKVEAEFDTFYRDRSDADYELVLALLAEVRKDVSDLLQTHKKAQAIYHLAQAEILLLILFNYFREKLEAIHLTHSREEAPPVPSSPPPMAPPSPSPSGRSAAPSPESRSTPRPATTMPPPIAKGRKEEKPLPLSEGIKKRGVKKRGGEEKKA